MITVNTFLADKKAKRLKHQQRLTSIRIRHIYDNTRSYARQPPDSDALEEVLNEVTGFDKGLDANKYTILTPSGQAVYWATEDSGCCNRNCCGRGRSFRMSVLDSQHSEVLSLDRPLR